MMQHLQDVPHHPGETALNRHRDCISGRPPVCLGQHEQGGVFPRSERVDRQGGGCVQGVPCDRQAGCSSSRPFFARITAPFVLPPLRRSGLDQAAAEICRPIVLPDRGGCQHGLCVGAVGAFTCILPGNCWYFSTRTAKTVTIEGNKDNGSLLSQCHRSQCLGANPIFITAGNAIFRRRNRLFPVRKVGTPPQATHSKFAQINLADLNITYWEKTRCDKKQAIDIYEDTASNCFCNPANDETARHLKAVSRIKHLVTARTVLNNAQRKVT